jgi:hypothetical protein
MVQKNNPAFLTQQGISLIRTTDCQNFDAANSFTDDTEQFAELNGVKAQSVRKRYAQTGSYFGIRPLKLANRRLKWPHVFATQREAVAAAHVLLGEQEVA